MLHHASRYSIMCHAMICIMYFDLSGVITFMTSRVGCSLLRCGSRRKPGSRTPLNVVGAIDRSASEPRGQRQDHFEAFSAGVMSVRPQKNWKN